MKTATTVTPPDASSSAASFRHLCESLGVALVTTDVQLHIAFWNAAASRVFGAGADRMLGTPVGSMIPWERRHAAEDQIKSVIETGATVEFEFEHRDAKGERRELALTIAPILGDTDERVGASLCFRDITKRMALQKQLNDSEKLASLGRMAGAVAHHFNNVLGGVITSIDYANESRDPAIDRKVLEPVGKALAKAMGLVRGLLSFSEGDPRCDDLSDLSEVLTTTADEIDALVPTRNIQFTFELARLPTWPVKRAPLQTILTNIVQNAIEAMPSGGVLRIAARLRDGSVEIEIADTGVGLDEATKSRLFEPFFTTKGALGAGPGHAAGLGLAIAHGLATMIGAKITVASESHRGTCFTVTLPRIEPA